VPKRPERLEEDLDEREESAAADQHVAEHLQPAAQLDAREEDAREERDASAAVHQHLLDHAPVIGSSTGGL
jgi:hypothetical protein